MGCNPSGEGPQLHGPEEIGSMTRILTISCNALPPLATACLCLAFAAVGCEGTTPTAGASTAETDSTGGTSAGTEAAVESEADSAGTSKPDDADATGADDEVCLTSPEVLIAAAGAQLEALQAKFIECDLSLSREPICLPAEVLADVIDTVVSSSCSELRAPYDASPLATCRDEYDYACGPSGAFCCGDVPATDATVSTLEIASDIVDDTFIARIAIPPGADDGSPVLYVLDGDSLFELATGFETQIRGTEQTQPAIVVGIGYGYPSAYSAPCGEGRWRDLSVVAEGDCSTGGAPRFVDALMSEIIPAVESELSISAGPRVLAGHSLGARTVLFTVLSGGETQAFAGAIAADGAAPEILELFADVEPNVDDLPISLYHLFGGQVGAEGVASFEQLNDDLNSAEFPNLTLQVELAPLDDHGDTQFTMFASGLRWMLTQGL